MGNTTGQGHKGISHPFGAKHDVTPWREPTYGERMYPNFINELVVGDATFAKTVQYERALEAVTYDFRALFDKERHDLEYHNGWMPYSPAPDAEIPYCSLGVRPLDGLKFSYGVTTEYGHMEHLQMLCSDRRNFGLGKNTGTKSGIFVEAPERLSEYTVSPVKYRQDAILKAQKAVDEGWMSRFATQNPPGCRLNIPFRYSFKHYNCQHYLRDVMKKSLEMTKESGIPLVINY